MGRQSNSKKMKTLFTCAIVAVVSQIIYARTLSKREAEVLCTHSDDTICCYNGCSGKGRNFGDNYSDTEDCRVDLCDHPWASARPFMRCVRQYNYRSNTTALLGCGLHDWGKGKECSIEGGVAYCHCPAGGPKDGEVLADYDLCNGYNGDVVPKKRRCNAQKKVIEMLRESTARINRSKLRHE